MNILVWNECYISGGADWSLIELLQKWPSKKDKFYIFINKTHEGYNLIKSSTVNNSIIFNFDSIIEMLNKILPKNNLISKILKKMLFYFFFLKSLKYFKLKIDNIKFDKILINNGGYPGALTAFAIIILNNLYYKKKLYLIIRNYPNKNSKINIWLARKIINFSSRVCVISVSKSLKKSIINDAGIKPRIIKVIYNGITKKRDFFNNKYKKINILKNSVGMIANYEERKGHLFLLSVWKNLVKKIPKAVLYLIGSNNHKNFLKIKEFVKKNKLNKNVKFLGYKTNLSYIYKKLKIIVIPSRYNESFGRIAIEAMAHGVPVIASKTGGLKEIIKNNVDGFLFEKNNKTKLNLLLIKILSRSLKLNKIKSNARKKFYNYFTSKTMSKNYFKLINSDNE